MFIIEYFQIHSLFFSQVWPAIAVIGGIDGGLWISCRVRHKFSLQVGRVLGGYGFSIQSPGGGVHVRRGSPSSGLLRGQSVKVAFENQSVNLKDAAAHGSSRSFLAVQ
jgi:hypothetical protein